MVSMLTVTLNVKQERSMEVGLWLHTCYAAECTFFEVCKIYIPCFNLTKCCLSARAQNNGHRIFHFNFRQLDYTHLWPDANKWHHWIKWKDNCLNMFVVQVAKKPASLSNMQNKFFIKNPIHRNWATSPCKL